MGEIGSRLNLGPARRGRVGPALRTRSLIPHRLFHISHPLSPAMPPSRIGPYRIVRKVGRGGMGTVYMGVDDSTGQTAAIKLLAAEMAQQPDFRERFRAEIETLRKLDHPNIVQILG